MPFFLLIAAVLIAVLAFEIFMFIDVIKNPKLNATEKLLWAAGMLLIHPFVAIAYYLVVRNRRSS